MKNKIIVLSLIGILLVVCGIKSQAKTPKNFNTISCEKYGNVIYDTRTGVEYWVSNSMYNYGTLTLLVDEDGNPLIYDKWDKVILWWYYGRKNL